LSPFTSLAAQKTDRRVPAFVLSFQSRQRTSLSSGFAVLPTEPTESTEALIPPSRMHSRRAKRGAGQTRLTRQRRPPQSGPARECDVGFAAQLLCGKPSNLLIRVIHVTVSILRLRGRALCVEKTRLRARRIQARFGEASPKLVAHALERDKRRRAGAAGRDS
jgi:hypothetical protein